jgi:hypothetical protein
LFLLIFIFLLRRNTNRYNEVMNTTPLSPSLLANKYQAPLAMVERLIKEESDIAFAEARVKTFVPIFVTRRVEERLRMLAADRRPVATAA